MHQGRFFDGKSAAEHAARVRLDADGAHIEAASGAVHWPRRALASAPRGAEVCLTSRTDPDARLVLTHTAALEEDLRRLKLDAGARTRRHVALGGALIGAGAALAALIFLGAPMAAEPLAAATPRDVEVKLGDNLTRQVHVFMRPCANTAAADAALAPLAARLSDLGDANFDIELSLVRADMPNAFALPGGRVFVTSGLLEELEHPDELAAVLAHEIGHVKARDSMIALYRHLGLGFFLEAVTGGTGVAQQILLLSGQMAELRYTRAQETRADAFAIATMRAAGFDPEALARAFERISARVENIREEPDRLAIPEWMMSHPNVGSRIDAARAAATPATRQALTPEAWAQVRAACAAPARAAD
jgi:beta-barrel assembly-enhancing protease